MELSDRSFTIGQPLSGSYILQYSHSASGHAQGLESFLKMFCFTEVQLLYHIMYFIGVQYSDSQYSDF